MVNILIRLYFSKIDGEKVKKLKEICECRYKIFKEKKCETQLREVRFKLKSKNREKGLIMRTRQKRNSRQRNGKENKQKKLQN